jgi:hypothetical protein
MARLCGIPAYELEQVEDNTPETHFLPALTLEIMAELWRFVAEHPDEAKAFGTELAMAMHTHGPGYATWLVLNERCSGIQREEELAETEAAMIAGEMEKS